MKQRNYFTKLFFVAILFLTLFGCSKDSKYDSKEAIKRGDIVYQDKVTNFERFEEFLNNVKNNKEDKIRITVYTKEGDSIFQDLHFNKKEIRYNYDGSNDSNTTDKNLKYNDVCKEIQKSEENKQINYYVNNCSKKDKYFLISTEK